MESNYDSHLLASFIVYPEKSWILSIHSFFVPMLANKVIMLTANVTDTRKIPDIYGLDCPIFKA